MVAHPIESVIVNGSHVNKALLREEIKKYVRDFESVVNFRTYDLPGVEAAIIADNFYNYDSADLVTADNGTTCIHDASGRRFKRLVIAVSGETIFRSTAIAGTANAPEITTNGLATLSATPQLILVVFTLSNSGAMTIKYDAQTATNLRSPSGAALSADEVMGGRPYLISATSTESRIYMSGVTW